LDLLLSLDAGIKSMVKNYITVALRNLSRYKSYTIINVMGLAIGLACSILIMLYVYNEKSFDRFNVNSDRIYRIYVNGKIGNNVLDYPTCPYLLPSVVASQNKEIVSFVRFFPDQNKAVSCNGKLFYEDKLIAADSDFFNVFTIPLLEGDKNEALRQPNSIVLTKSTSEKYFGNECPLGKKLTMNNIDTAVFTITGVCEDVPYNSHFSFDFVYSLSTWKSYLSGSWLSMNIYAYFLLKENTDIALLEKKINQINDYNVNKNLGQVDSLTLEKFNKAGNKIEYLLQSLNDIHIHSQSKAELGDNKSITFIYVFSVVAIFILILACINFINLSTARSSTRAKEIGIRKIIGSTRKQLIFQFTIESVLLTFLSFLLAIIIVEISLPVYGKILGTNITINYFSSNIIIPLITGVFVIGILAGLYPAFLLSRFNHLSVIKGKPQSVAKTKKLRNLLVISQFVISIAIIIGTILVYSQLQYMRSMWLGYDKESVMVIERTDPIKNSISDFINDLKAKNGVQSVSLSSNVPGRMYGFWGVLIEGRPASDAQGLCLMIADQDFAKTYGMQVSEGRFFDSSNPEDTNCIVINESAVKSFNLTAPVGQRIILPWRNYRNYKIIGVLKDFNYESLKNNVNPVGITLINQPFDGYVSVRIKSGYSGEVLREIQKTWLQYEAYLPLSYFFVDKDLNRFYTSEESMGEVMGIFSFISVVIACLGLFGLVAFIAEQRTREIGIRKVFGASINSIVLMLSREIMKLIFISAIIACPLAYLVIKQWLRDYAYPVPINPIIFLLVILLILLIALVTVGYQAIRAARQNPVEAIKYE
jgi:putative ABC transport system permease protein